MIEFSIYIPRRRACKKHSPSVVALGIGNMVAPNTYVPLVDIDRKIKRKGLYDIIRAGYNVFGRETGYYIASTMKGYHIIWHTLVDWRTLNRLWTRLKPYLDWKWVKLQRRRGYAVVRVRGKYSEKDIELIEEKYVREHDYHKLLYMWLRIYKYLVS